MNHVPKLIDDRDLYGRDYFIGHYLHDPKRDAMYRQEYRRISQRCRAGGSVLDVGCGVGKFLEIFADCWQRYGYEPSNYAAGRAAVRDVMIVPCLSEMENETMDLVVFRGTLQHINEPVGELAEATRILRSGGRIAILATPDIDSLVYRIWHDLPALEAPRNWILFGSHFLKNILCRLGYEQIEILHPYLETPYANPISDFTRFGLSLMLGYRKFAFPGNMMEVYAVKI